MNPSLCYILTLLLLVTGSTTAASDVVLSSDADDQAAVIVPIEPMGPVEPIAIEPEGIMVAPTETITSQIPRAPKPAPGTPTRVLTGKLVREIHSFGPRYPIRLKAPSGRQIAYVDISRIFISDLRPYLDKTVYISGEVHPIVPGSSDLVIVARTMRINQ